MTNMFQSSKYYENREISWLKFNRRVLAMVQEKGVLLLERAKFLAITASNLDEFFMVRVAALFDIIQENSDEKDISGLSPKEQLTMIDNMSHDFFHEQYRLLYKSVIPKLLKEDIKLYGRKDALSPAQEVYIKRYYRQNVYPVLTPMAYDIARPFPLIRNKTLNIGVLLTKDNKSQIDAHIEYAIVQVPDVLPRVVAIPDTGEKECFILLEDIIEKHLDTIFINYKILSATPFRITRDADFEVSKDESDDLLHEIERQVKQRQRGEAMRLEILADCPDKLRDLLKEKLRLRDNGIYRIKGAIDLGFLFKLYQMTARPELKYKHYTPKVHPRYNRDESIFEQIKRGDILLFHPYQSFDIVLDFIQAAAFDEDVLAIKQTLYRVSGQSPIISSLAHAAENGKQVTVLVELQARFDEENNIGWAKTLEKAGCHVIYGLMGLKTHCKITMVVRCEPEGIRRYVHLGTGNYNDSTAKLYTDFGLLTANESFGEDATGAFNMISGYSEPSNWNRLVLAPIWMREHLLALIDKEILNAQNNIFARIIIKINSINDPQIMEALYRAAQNGVKVDLIVRGICCMRVGMAETKGNLSVRSIVGRYLEHARIYYFENAGEPSVFLSSGDLLTRNLVRRVEIMFPVIDKTNKETLIHVLKVQLNDTQRAFEMLPDGEYKRPDGRKRAGLNCQDWGCEWADMEVKQTADINDRVFTPIYAE